MPCRSTAGGSRSSRSPTRPGWTGAGAGVEAVVEATGRFLGRQKAAAHLGHGAAGGDLRQRRSGRSRGRHPLPGAQRGAFDPDRHAVVSNASCTTNCLALVAKVLHDRFRVRRALMSAVHSYTESQRLLDLPHPDPRRARAAALNIVPTSTTAAGRRAAAPGAGRPGRGARRTGAHAHGGDAGPGGRAGAGGHGRDGARRPSVMPRTACWRASSESRGGAGLLGLHQRSALGRGGPAAVQIVNGGLARVVAWYDNEWGYAHRLADLLVLLGPGGAARPYIGGGGANG